MKFSFEEIPNGTHQIAIYRDGYPTSRLVVLIDAGSLVVADLLRLGIDAAGNVSIKGTNSLFLNFGQESRAQQFLDLRLSQGFDRTQIKTFQVPTSYVDELRGAAVPESMARQFPGSPIAVDVNRAPDQFGLRAAQLTPVLRSVHQTEFNPWWMGYGD